jgi:predicted cobalt transporter CbtA
MKQWPDRLALIVITMWVGALWAVGYLAAPTLFYALDNRQLAGMLAGKMFTLVAYVGIGAAFYLLIHQLLRFGTAALRQGVFWIVIVMLLLVLAGHFGIQPLLDSLKAQAMPADVMQSIFADRFRTWHGIASIAYLLESLLGIALVLKARQ